MKPVHKVLLNRGVVYHCHDGYYFKKNVLKGSKLYLKCIVESCPVRGLVHVDLNKPIRISRPSIHNHPPNIEFLKIQILKRKLYHRCENEDTSPQLIYDEEIANIDEDIALELYENSLVNTMNKKKLLGFWSISNLQSYVDAFNDERYKSYFVTTEGLPFFHSMIKKHTILFISPVTRLLLYNKIITYTIDRVCKFVPKVLQHHQLISIAAICPKKIISIAYAIMKNGKLNHYIDLFEKLKEIEPSWDPHEIFTDYDEEVRTAINVAFPRCTIFGCWFHFSQAVRGKAHQLGLLDRILSNSELHKYVKMCLALPTLPPHLISYGFEAVSMLILCLPDTSDFVPFLEYVSQHWILGVNTEQLSVYGDSKRINNYHEVYHGYLSKYLSGRTKEGVCPNLLRLIRGLIRVDHFFSSTFKSKQYHNFGDNYDLNYGIHDSRIMKAFDKFKEDNFTVPEFLQLMSHITMDITEFDDIYYPLVSTDDDSSDTACLDSGKGYNITIENIYWGDENHEANDDKINEDDYLINNDKHLIVEDHPTNEDHLTNEVHLIHEDNLFKEDHLITKDCLITRKWPNDNLTNDDHLTDEETQVQNVANDSDDGNVLVEEVYDSDGNDKTHAVPETGNILGGEVFYMFDYVCVRCNLEPRTCASVPCGHLCICETCKSKYTFKSCPTCEKPIMQMMTIHIN